jgi:predicted O-methyltransferase YrrM
LFRLIARFLARSQLGRNVKRFTKVVSWSEIEQVRHLVKSIDGSSDFHCILLYVLAKYGPRRGAIVEIGSWKGKSTIWLAKGSKSVGREKVFAVDPIISTEPEFRRNIKRAEVSDWVIQLAMKSSDAVANWKKPIRLLWVDGSHEYEDVKKDVHLWGSHLVYGGIIVLHDLGLPGPRKEVREALLNSNNFSNIGLLGGLVFAKKVDKLNMSERLSKFIVSIQILLINLIMEHIPHKIARSISHQFYLPQMDFRHYGSHSTRRSDEGYYERVNNL